MIEYFKPFLSKQGIRVLEIHNLLRRGGKYTHIEIRRCVEESDGSNNGNYSIRNFNEDKKFLREILDAPLMSTPQGLYYYKEKFSLLPKQGLMDQDMEILENLSSAAGKYRDLPFFSELELLIKKIKPHHKKKEIIGFEGAPVQYGGIEHFEDLFWSIHQNRELEIEYQQFGGEPIHTTVHPHYLKEYGHRWYLFTWNKDLEAWRTYALDRLKVVEEKEEDSFLKREEFDPQTFWKHSVGIIFSQEEPVNFSFEVKDGTTIKNIDYLRTMPIHHSQKLSEEKNGYVKVELTVHPFVELFREIRALGQNNVKNIQPKKYEKLIWEE